MQLVDILQMGISELKKAGVAAYENDARLLLESVLDKSRTELYLAAKSQIDAVELEKYLTCIQRRKKREPVAYILGEQEFWSLPFHVSPTVLIPRPETEFLLDRVLTLTDKRNFSRGKILDLCTGSGVIATVLAKETGEIVFASDISERALFITRKNARRNNLLERVLPVSSDLFSAFCNKQVFSLIVSNPPYVSRQDLKESLAPEVSAFEPHIALDGGDQGLDIIFRIRQELPQFLVDGGQFFMEIGADQGTAVRAMFEGKSVQDVRFTDVEIISDYAGRDRVLHARIVTKNNKV